MKKLIIIGAGGMGRSLYNMAVGSLGYGEELISRDLLMMTRLRWMGLRIIHR